MDKQPELVDEPRVEFRATSDLSVYKIVNEEINETLVEFTGYDLQINFNMAHINSIQDVEAACEGISQLFRDLIMEKLLEHKKQNDQ